MTPAACAVGGIGGGGGVARGGGGWRRRSCGARILVSLRGRVRGGGEGLKVAEEEEEDAEAE